MKRNFYIMMIALAACFIMQGCVFVNFTDISAVKPKGNPEDFEIFTGSYTGLKIEGYCELKYFSAPSDTVILTVQPNLRKYYIIEVINNDLVVRTTKRISFRQAGMPVLTISAPVLNRISIEGACEFSAFDAITADSLNLSIAGACNGKARLDVGRLTVNISGTGNIQLSGKAATADLRLSGMGELDALPLETENAAVNLSGAGTIRVSCSEYLRINASGAGTVAYRGSPGTDINTNGVVNVRKLD